MLLLLKSRTLLILMILLTFTAVGQADITPKISDCLKKGDAALLSTFFMNPVELSIMDQDESYDPKAAQQIISNFFRQNPPKDFSIKHQGTSKLDDQYRIGELITSKGNYRVTFFMKKSGSLMLIKQLKIEAPGGNF